MLRVSAGTAAITGALLATALVAMSATAQPPVAVTSTAAGFAMLACLWRRAGSTATDWLVTQTLITATAATYALVSQHELGTLAEGAILAAAATFLLIAVATYTMVGRHAADHLRRRRRRR